ncbi:MAG: DinB family protein [Bryobacteraceae bacterium]
MLPSFDMNPYASFLADRDVFEVIAATPRELEILLDEIGPENAEKSPAPGKWSCRDIICHLADCEIVFAFRIRQTLAEDNHVVQPFDQDKWANPYAAYQARAALAVFTAVRNWNLTLVHAAGKAVLTKPLSHPERGEMTLGVLLETMGGHDLNHLRQIEAIRSRSATA